MRSFGEDRSDPIIGLEQTLILFLFGLGLRTFEVLDEPQAAALCKFVVKVYGVH